MGVFYDLGVWFGYIYTLGFGLEFLFGGWIIYLCYTYILCILSYFREEETHGDLQIGVGCSDNSDKNLEWRTSLVTLAFSLLISIQIVFALTLPFHF